VVALASRHAFARALVNTGRMSVANAYPPAPHLPEGARSVQNLPLRWADGHTTTLMQLLAEGSDCLGIWFAPTRAQVEALGALPLRLLAVGGDSSLPMLQPDAALARHLGDPTPGDLCLVRPDAYLAATLRVPTASALAAALRTTQGEA
jgi:3-(3-hydroxy-phenyl)propionate hydroxylase